MQFPFPLPEPSQPIFKVPGVKPLLIVRTHEIRPLWFSKPNVMRIPLPCVRVFLSLLCTHTIPPSCGRSCGSLSSQLRLCLSYPLCGDLFYTFSCGALVLPVRRAFSGLCTWMRVLSGCIHGTSELRVLLLCRLPQKANI